MSVIAVARSKIILELLKADVSIQNILQIWFSSCLSSSAQRALRKVCETLSDNEGDIVLKNLFEFWKNEIIDIDSAKLRWSQYLSTSQMTPLSNLRMEHDRVDYARYLLTGQIFIKGKEKPVVGNAAMFESPAGYRNYKKTEESFFYTLSMHNFCYKKSLMASVAERTLNGIQILRTLVREEKIDIILKVQKFEGDPETDLFTEVKHLDPHSIEWSNIPDYMTPRQFLTMAERCSSVGTTHTFHSKNWGRRVFGSHLLDYFPPGVFANKSLVDYNGQVERMFRKLEKLYNDKFSSAKSSQPFLRQDRIYGENVMNIANDILADKFKNKYVEFFFEGYSVELLDIKMEPFNIFMSCFHTVFVAFRFSNKI